jgi:hypothetical protein
VAQVGAYSARNARPNISTAAVDAAYRELTKPFMNA